MICFFEVIDEFGNPIANDQIFAFYSQWSLPTPPRDHIIRVAGQLPSASTIAASIIIAGVIVASVHTIVASENLRR